MLKSVGFFVFSLFGAYLCSRFWLYLRQRGRPAPCQNSALRAAFLFWAMQKAKSEEEIIQRFKDLADKVDEQVRSQPPVSALAEIDAWMRNFQSLCAALAQFSAQAEAFFNCGVSCRMEMETFRSGLFKNQYFPENEPSAHN
jgi:hypothetical protein